MIGIGNKVKKLRFKLGECKYGNLCLNAITITKNRVIRLNHYIGTEKIFIDLPKKKKFGYWVILVHRRQKAKST